MKILHVTQNFLPFQGGVEKQIYEMSRRLVRRGFDIEILCGYESSNRRSALIDGILVKRVRAFKVLPLAYELGRIAPGMLLEIRRSNADVIHAHSYGFFSTWTGLLSRKPLVITPHSDPTAKIYPLRDALRMLPIERAAKLIANTEMEYKHLIKRGADPDRITIIPNGITLPSIGRRMSRIGNSIFCLGRLDIKHKGQDVLIEAMEDVKSCIDDVNLEISGTGRDLAYLQLLVKKKRLDDCVSFTGPIDESTKEEKLRTCSLFCVSPRTESFGISFLEAMCFGAPIVSTNVGGISKVVGDAALLVRHDDPKELADAIIEVLSNRKTAMSLGRKGLKRAKLFDWELLIEKYVRLYKSLVS